MKNSKYLIIGFLALLLTSCEEEFDPIGVEFEEELVVEGYIELGEEAFPPYVLLTKTFPYNAAVGSNTINELFVHDAEVKVTDDEGVEVVMEEYCLDDLPPNLRREIVRQLGIDVNDIMGLELCAYVDLLGEINLKEGGTYTLDIETVDNQLLKGVTTIPVHVPLDSVYFTEPPGKPNEDYAEMNCFITDPEGPNFYRFLTAENDGVLTAAFGTVTDDVFFDGQEFTFPISKAESPNDDVDLETFGLWEIGDTSTLKWITIDEEHYRFWLTFEFNRNNQGPFATYTRVEHNIEGGLGIWGGLSSSLYTQIVEIK